MDAPQYIYLAVFSQCLAAYVFHYKKPVKTEKKGIILLSSKEITKIMKSNI
jgi:hypothetical protein